MPSRLFTVDHFGQAREQQERFPGMGHQLRQPRVLAFTRRLVTAIRARIIRVLSACLHVLSRLFNGVRRAARWRWRFGEAPLWQIAILLLLLWWCFVSTAAVARKISPFRMPPQAIHSASATAAYAQPAGVAQPLGVGQSTCIKLPVHARRPSAPTSTSQDDGYIQDVCEMTVRLSRLSGQPRGVSTLDTLLAESHEEGDSCTDYEVQRHGARASPDCSERRLLHHRAAMFMSSPDAVDAYHQTFGSKSMSAERREARYWEVCQHLWA